MRIRKEGNKFIAEKIVETKFVEFDSRKYFVVHYKDNGHLGFIQREKYGCGNYQARCFNDLTKGSNWWAVNSNLRELVEDLLENGYEVHVFDTEKEFIQYVAANIK